MINFSTIRHFTVMSLWAMLLTIFSHTAFAQVNIGANTSNAPATTASSSEEKPLTPTEKRKKSDRVSNTYKFPEYSAQHEIFLQLPEDIQKEIWDETNVVYNVCNSHSIYATYQDCECIKFRFLDARITEPDKHRNDLMNSLAHHCPNKPAIAGDQYQKCMNRNKSTGSFKEEESKAFCECVGNYVAELYAKNPANSIKSQKRYTINAQMHCGMADLEKRALIDHKRKKAERENVLP
jgi:hypothetical protein